MISPRIAVIGAGTIGSSLIELLARSARLASLVIIDPDHYAAGNLATQAIQPADVGQAKAEVMARRAAALHPDLLVQPVVANVRALPFGFLFGRVDIVCSCVDNNATRVFLSRLCSRLGLWHIDAGVLHRQAAVSDAQAQRLQGDLYARLDVYAPTEDGPCYACGMSAQDYARFGVVHACLEKEQPIAPTNAPAALGALAGSLAALEVQSVLADVSAMAGNSFVLHVGSHQGLVTKMSANANCRVGHDRWQVVSLPLPPELISIADVQQLGLDAGLTDPLMLSVAGGIFSREQVCEACGHTEATPPVLTRRFYNYHCQHCGGSLRHPGYRALEQLALTDLPSDTLLAQLGVQSGDILLVCDAAGERRFHLGGA